MSVLWPSSTSAALVDFGVVVGASVVAGFFGSISLRPCCPCCRAWFATTAINSPGHSPGVRFDDRHRCGARGPSGSGTKSAGARTAPRRWSSRPPAGLVPRGQRDRPPRLRLAQRAARQCRGPHRRARRVPGPSAASSGNWTGRRRRPGRRSSCVSVAVAIIQGRILIERTVFVLIVDLPLGGPGRWRRRAAASVPCHRPRPSSGARRIVRARRRPGWGGLFGGSVGVVVVSSRCWRCLPGSPVRPGLRAERVRRAGHVHLGDARDRPLPWMAVAGSSRSWRPPRSLARSSSMPAHRWEAARLGLSTWRSWRGSRPHRPAPGDRLVRLSPTGTEAQARRGAAITA